MTVDRKQWKTKNNASALKGKKKKTIQITKRIWWINNNENDHAQKQGSVVESLNRKAVRDIFEKEKKEGQTKLKKRESAMKELVKRLTNEINESISLMEHHHRFIFRDWRKVQRRWLFFSWFITRIIVWFFMNEFPHNKLLALFLYLNGDSFIN
jgi:hypothetical protein